MLQGKNNVESPAVTRTQTQSTSGLGCQCSATEPDAWQPANHQSTLMIDWSFICTHSFQLFFRQILEWKPWIWGYQRCLRTRLHYPCLHMHSLLKSSVPKLEKMRNTKSLTNWVAMYSWVHAAVIRVVKYETLDISSSTGSQSTGYSSSCLWPFSAINKQTNKINKQTSHSLQFHAYSTKWKY